MLSAIEAEGLREVAVLVTRHYGGIQLGTGGLARAYGGAARKALKACERVEVRPMVALHVTVPYELVGVVYNILGGSQGEEHFLNDSVRIDVEVEAGEAERVGQKITDVTRGKAHVEIATC